MIFYSHESCWGFLDKRLESATSPHERNHGGVQLEMGQAQVFDLGGQGGFSGEEPPIYGHLFSRQGISVIITHNLISKNGRFQ